MPAKSLIASLAGLRTLAAAADLTQSGTYPSSTTYPANGGGANARYPGPTDYPLQAIPGGGTYLYPGRGTDVTAVAEVNTTLIASVY